jgi:hypothetical protein
MNIQNRATSGLKLLFKEVKGFSQVQGAWRFLNNPNIIIEDLFNPVLDNLSKEIDKQCDKYLLAPSDWCWLDYKKHTSKKDLIIQKNKGNTKKIGLDLQSTIGLSDRTGEPIASISHNLKTNKKVYSTYDNNIDMKLTHLEELVLRAKRIFDFLKTTKKIVHIVDREADSIAFIRDLIKNSLLFLLRVKNNSKVFYYDKDLKKDVEIKQIDLANRLSLGKKVKDIKYKNKKVTIYVNECPIIIKRDATKMVTNKDGKKKLIRTNGESVKVRFIVERLVDKKGKIVAQWLLISNIFDTAVTSETLATWYYYRWKIESYFKLLKSSGFNLEQWQQVEPEALFKRLLIVSQATMLVWKIANDSSSNAKQIREFLIQLSGSQMQRGVDFTYPALLSGLESYLMLIEVHVKYDDEKVLKLRDELVEIMGFEI